MEQTGQNQTNSIKKLSLDTDLWNKDIKLTIANNFTISATNLLEQYNNTTLNDNYKKAILYLVYDILFWTNKTKILTVPMPTGSGKSTITELTLANMYNNSQMKRHCGTIILKLRIDDCNTTANNINKYAGKDIAYAYHSGEFNNSKSEQISDDTLFTYPIIVLTHEGYKALIQRHEEGTDQNKKKKRHKKYISELLNWTDKRIDKLTVNYNIFDRNRLIIDEEISNVEPVQINMKAIEELKNCILNMGNNILYNNFITFISQIEKEFIKPYNETANKIYFTYFNNIEIPDGLDEAIYNSKNYKAREIYIDLLNLLQHGGYRHYSSDKDYKSITTYKYTNIFDPRFKKIQLDATANVNPLYSFNTNYRIQQIPDFKTYHNTYIHVFDKITGSRASINNNYKNGLLIACYKDIESKLSNNEKALVVFNNKDLQSDFYEQTKDNKLFQEHRIWYTHYGETTGSNQWKDYDKIFVIGLNILNDACYPLFYFCNSDETNFNKYDTTLIPQKGSRQYAEERFELTRKGMVASSLIQAINRIKIRKYSNGDTLETHIYIINADKDIDEIIKNSMKGINVLYDWNLNYELPEKEKKNPVENNAQCIINLLKCIIDNPDNKKNLIKSKIIKNNKIPKKYIRDELGFNNKPKFHRALESPLFKQFCQDYNITISVKTIDIT